MSIFNWFTDIFSSDSDSISLSDSTFLDISANDIEMSSFNDSCINPASGLPMIDGIGGFDVAGNTFGSDFSHDSMTSSSFDNDFMSSSSSSIDDSWSSSSDSCFSDW